MTGIEGEGTVGDGERWKSVKEKGIGRGGGVGVELRKFFSFSQFIHAFIHMHSFIHSSFQIYISNRIVVNGE